MPLTLPARGKWLTQLLWTGLVLYFIGSLTLESARQMPTEPIPPFACLLGCGNQEVRDLISNIILFVPLGWVLRYWMRRQRAVALAFLASCGIEATQAFVLLGRYPSLRDILTNTIGAAIGTWLFDNWPRLRYPQPDAAWRLSQAAAGGWFGVMLLTGIGLHTAPTTGSWFGQWAGDLAQYAHFEGEVKEVLVDGWTPPMGPMDRAEPLRQAIAKQQLTMHILAISGPPTRPTALMFGAFDARQAELMMVGSAVRSIQLQLRTRFDAWELRGLSLRLPLSPGTENGDTLDVTAMVRPGAWGLVLRSRGETDSIALPLTLGIGWATLLPMPLAMAYEWYVMNALWMATLIAPAAYFGFRSDRKRTLRIGGPMVVVALILLPLLLHTGTTTISDWIGIGLGGLSGFLLARRSFRHPASADAAAIS